MKTFKTIALVALLAVVAYAAVKQAQEIGASKITVPSTANVDALTLTQNDTGQNALTVSAGGVVFASRTKAQLVALTPTAAGQMFICGDCGTAYSNLCISSGTGAAAYVQVSSPTISCCR